MIKHTGIFSLVLFLILAGCSQQPISKGAGDNGEARPIAFPGAEGFGKYTTGGRGGEVYTVTNLNDKGPGSLRDGVSGKSPRIIVFAVSGTIHLESPLNIRGNMTIAGQTAPGDGICLADYPVKLNGDNIIVRYLRFRMGDRYQNQGMVPGSGHDDALTAYRRKNIMIDHCSISWSTDEVLSVYAGDSSTVQWSLIAEPLNYSYHFETGDKDFEHHGYGGILGGKHLTFHHNVYAHCVSRTPRFDGNRNLEGATDMVDFRNNIIYNWESNNVYGGEGGTYNLVGNFYKPGPSTKANASHRILNPYKIEGKLPYGRFYLNDNFVDGSPVVTQYNWSGVVMDKGSPSDTAKAMAETPFPFAPVKTQTPAEAYSSVLAEVGASLPARDAVDQRIILDVRNHTGRIIDVQGGFPHGTPYEKSKGAWPELKTAPARPDTDKDGMPDDWEKKNKLNPNDAADAAQRKLQPYFTNVEVYINSLVPARK